jgi:hypothetical protein
LQATARSTVVLQDYSIYNNARVCPQGPADGGDPVKLIAAMVRRYQPGFTLRDSAKGIEQSGTCAIQLRLDGPSGTIMMITVIPPVIEFTPFVALFNDAKGSALDLVTDVDGWKVEIGAVGLVGALPSERDLDEIANDPRITWSFNEAP